MRIDSAAPHILDQLPVLSDGVRSRLLAVLDGQELTVSELCDALQLPQSTVSRHLKTLSDAGWVSSRREGTSRFYALPHDELDTATRKLWQLVREDISASRTWVQDARRLTDVLSRRRRRSEEFFSTVAGQWDRLREDLFGAASHFRALLAWLDETWVVGDLGCGTGQVTEAVAPYVHQVVAVDASAEMLLAARDRLRGVRNVAFHQGALEHLPLADATLDATCLMLVLHHLPDPQAVLAEAARVTKPGGRLLVVDMVPHERDEYRRAMGHVWLGFSERQMKRWLAAAGLERPRWHALTGDTKTKGPGLFAAAATRRVAPGETGETADAGSAGGRT
jgi:ArsR family transcriptional regulator